MEKIESSRKILVTKISYISNIMVYYGFIHEWAELYRQLCKDSREEWDKNVNIIVKVIMKHKNSRCKMEFKNEFSNKQAKYLLKDNTYNYYRIGICLYNTQSLKSFTKFIKNLNQYSTDLFYSVSINYIAANHSYIQSMFEIYFMKKFEGEAIELTRWKLVTQDLLFSKYNELRSVCYEQIIMKNVTCFVFTREIL